MVFAQLIDEIEDAQRSLARNGSSIHAVIERSRKLIAESRELMQHADELLARR